MPAKFYYVGLKWRRLWPPLVRQSYRARLNRATDSVRSDGLVNPTKWTVANLEKQIDGSVGLTIAGASSRTGQVASPRVTEATGPS